MKRKGKQKKYFAIVMTVLMILSSIGAFPHVTNADSTNLSTKTSIKNLAPGKKITSSVAFSNMGVINDGVKNNTNAYSEDYPNGSGLQWIQIDLGKSFDVSAVNIWRYWSDDRTYRDLIVRLSNTSDFSGEVTTVFNNDTNNSAGFGIGKDAEYKETSTGKSVSFVPVNAKYVRVYSGGSTANTNNHFVEVEVMGAELPPTEAPATPTGYAYPMGTSRINASWNVPEGASSYDIEVDGQEISDVNMPFGQEGLSPETTHTYRVRAKNFLGTSEWSEPFSGTTLAPVTVGSRFMGPDPGSAQGTNPEEGVYELSNSILSAKFQLSENNLTLAEFRNKLEGDVNPIKAGELFSLEFSGAANLIDTDMTAGAPTLTRITGKTSSMKVSDRDDGWQLSVPFTYTDQGKTLTLNWSATLRDGSNYMIQDVSYTAASGNWNVTKVKLIDITATGVEKAGAVDGSPFFAGKVFFAQQTPVAKVSVMGNVAKAYVDRGDETLQGQSFEQSSVIGIYPYNQKFRGFQYYIERERAHEHYSFLHYNSWYDLSWIFDTYMTEEESLKTINMWGEKFIQQRGAPLKNFLFDDGYDDYSTSAKTIWDFNPVTFPNGASVLKTAAEDYGASLGFWLSPTGGYYQKLPARVAIGKKMSSPTETKASGNEEIFKMSGPNYYNVFKDAVTKKQLQEGTKHFKFDRTEGIEDFHALLRLTGDMRENDPSVFINATVGSWASPYFTFYVDSIWRGGGDMGKTGTGSIRQQWVNYRDKVSRDLLQQNPFYPLNSLMVHGIVHSRFGQGAWVSHENGTESGPLLDMTKEVNLKDFSDEVWSFFASGYNLQELYIRPTEDYTTDKMWDILAEASAWAELNHNVLLDSHFIGGDPGKDAYGIASYSTSKGVLMLRNPSSTSQTISVDVSTDFVLPPGAKANYRLVNKLSEGTDIHLKAGTPYTFTIPAHSILLYEAYPEGTEVIPGEITNHAPVAKSGKLTTPIDTPVSGTMSASDEDQDPLTFSIVKEAAKGTVVIDDAEKGTFTYTPNSGVVGVDTFTFKVSDGKKESETATVTIHIGDEVTVLSTNLSGPSSVKAGDSFKVQYGLNHVEPPVLAQEVLIDYDADTLEFISAESLLENVSILEPIKNTAGKLHMILFSQGMENAVAGDAQLVELTFKAKDTEKDVTRKVSITKALLGDAEGVESEAAPSDLSIKVTAQTSEIVPDLNNDGKVTIGDLAIVAAAYGKNTDSPDWLQVKKADINKDGKIDIADLAAVATRILQ
ncbi:Ig-like domain-containing protein [Paenibacillus sp. GCM10028914]|uniref:Ig-like domain-containing protein n=1 Tax=Paenibacillus sp. GCM10028914 TaxID=3273416 RepID=UPI003618C11B